MTNAGIPALAPPGLFVMLRPRRGVAWVVGWSLFVWRWRLELPAAATLPTANGAVMSWRHRR